ncbi:MAG: hypothetical protein PHY16_17520 [Methylobacter sp.]|nr:hypothetical protein [Methylobacter sp.]
MILKGDMSSVFLYKRAYLTEVISVGLSIMGLIFINFLIVKFFRIDLNLLLESYKPLFIPKFVSGLNPEPLERLQYQTTTIVTPFVLLIFYIAAKKVLASCQKNINYLYTLLVPIGLSLLFVLVFFDLKKDPINFYFYTEKTAPYVELRQQIFPKLITYISLTFLSLPFFIFLVLVDYKRGIGKIINGLFNISLLFMLIVIFLINIFGENGYPGTIYHFNAVYYSVAQVFNGNSILVELTSQ